MISRDREGELRLQLYASTYYLALYRSSQGDGYRIRFLDSRNLGEHERLSRGAIWIQAQGWELHSELREIDKGSSNFWDHIYRAWRDFEVQRSVSQEELQEGLSYAHEHYLDTVEALIELTHRLEQDKANLNADIPYRGVESAGEERDAPRDIYVFRLADIPQLNEKSMLRLKEVPDLRGRVQALEGRKLTLKFENLVDRKRIHEQGSLEPMVSQLIYQKQRDAVEMLREGRARNIHLLRALVEHNYLPFHPDRIAQSSDEELKLLTPEQFEAFRRALTVPDLLMVLGPPATG
ncbi:MAG: hypothetical protein J2P37_35080, partial [Ktedonobacteraceae bacterium]|nr:hypothetical protein [Ktedonobacteraceae bacterium]